MNNIKQELLDTTLPYDYKDKLVVLICEDYPASRGNFGLTI